MPTLSWIGKEKVINHHLDVPFKVLEHKFGFSKEKGETAKEETNSGNKIIHGDNLEALKTLLPEYEGKVKCIYIDPPYIRVMKVGCITIM
jgi:adenine-specific DNA-methyltransferase